MNINNVIIRLENKDDFRKVEELVRNSFWNVYRPGAYEHYVLHLIRGDKDFIKELDFVMLLDNEIIGQNVFVKANISLTDGSKLPIATMGPICIANSLKRKGYGKILLDYSLDKAREFGIGALCFEGNIDFYGKSGFRYAREFGIKYHGLKDGDDDSFFLCKELIPGYLNGIKGVYQTPSIYMVDEKEVDEFDKSFPAKQKLKLPGQIF